MELTRCDLMRELNHSAANLGDCAPSKRELGRRNSKVKDYMLSIYGMTITWNSTCNARKVLPADYLESPSDMIEEEIDQKHLFTVNKVLSGNSQLASYIDMKMCVTSNIAQMTTVLNDLCRQFAPFHLHDMFNTGKSGPRGVPKNIMRGFYDEL